MGRRTRQRLARLENPTAEDRNLWQVEEWLKVLDAISKEGIDVSTYRGRRKARKFIKSNPKIQYYNASLYVRLLKEKEKQALQLAYYEDLLSKYLKGVEGNLNEDDLRYLQKLLKHSDTRDKLSQVTSNYGTRDELTRLVHDLPSEDPRSDQTNIMVNRFPFNSDKETYIRLLNSLPTPTDSELNFEGTVGKNIDVIVGNLSSSSKPATSSKNTRVLNNANTAAYSDEVKQRIADLEYAINSGDLSKFYEDSKYFKKLKDYSRTEISNLAIRALNKMGEINYAIPYRNGLTMTYQRLHDIAQMSRTNTNAYNNKTSSLVGTPLDEYDILWLQLAPEHRTTIINDLKKELKALKGIK